MSARPVDLGPDNFRDFAQAAIASYYEKGMIVDGMLWGRIIAHYEAALLERDPTIPPVAEAIR